MNTKNSGLIAKTVKTVPKVHKKNFNKLLEYLKKNGNDQPDKKVL